MITNLSAEVFYVFTSLLILTSILTILLNGYLIIVIVKNKSLQILENTFLVNLAALNVIGGFVSFGHPVILSDNHNPYCMWLIVASTYVVEACLFQVTVMTVDKYIIIVHPFLHVRICSNRNVFLVTGFVHVVAAVTTITVSLFCEKRQIIHVLGSFCVLRCSTCHWASIYVCEYSFSGYA